MYSEIQAPAADRITETGGSSNDNGGGYETCAAICRVHGARHKNCFGGLQNKINSSERNSMEGRTRKLSSLTAVGILKFDLANILYVVRKLNSWDSFSVSLGCCVRQTRVLKHVWKCSNLRLLEPQTK
jgi:hypothetical protein